MDLKRVVVDCFLPRLGWFTYRQTKGTTHRSKPLIKSKNRETEERL